MSQPTDTGIGVTWAGLSLVQVTRIPRPVDDATRPRRDEHLEVATAALAAIYHRHVRAGRPWVFGWCRPRVRAPVTVWASGTAKTPGAGRDTGLSYPPAAGGRSIGGAHIHRMIETLPAWTRLNAVTDVLTAGATGLNPRQAGAVPLEAPPAGLADLLLDAWPEPFGWLVIAEALGTAEIAEQVALEGEAERDARTRSVSPHYRVAADRHAHRYRELRSGETTGLWRIHLLAGAADAPAAEAFAGLLATAFGVACTGYTFTAADIDPDKIDICLRTPTGAVGGSCSPVIAATPLLASLARPPDVEVPGLHAVRRPGFDVTPESDADVPVGDALDRAGQPAGMASVTTASLVRHTFVAGATGSGKSTTISRLLATVGVPWLVIEPAKAEYRYRMAAQHPHVIRPGDADTPAIGFNPLQPAPGFPLQTHVDLVRALFTAAFQADEPFPQILAAALTRCYQQTGWDLALSQPRTDGIRPRWPTLTDVQIAAGDVIAAAGYGPEVEANVTGFVNVRLTSLRLGTAGHFFEATHHLDAAMLLRSRVILEIEDVGDDIDKAFFIGATLLYLTEHLRARHRAAPGDGGLQHLTVIEEAHRLLRRTDQPGATNHAVETFAHLLAEVRAYGEGLIIADQIPTKLLPDVIKNTAVKIVHRLPARDDRDTVGATMGLTEQQSSHLISLSPGIAAVHADGMDQPILVHIPAPAVSPITGRTAPSVLELTTTETLPCSSACGARPCTLREETLARHVIEEQPVIAVWCDLTVLAHLLAVPAPLPGPRLLARITSIDRRLLACAVRHQVDMSVSARTIAIHRVYSPSLMRRHIVEDLQRCVTVGEPCPDMITSWALAAFHWNPVRFALARLLGRDPDSSIHPDTATWRTRYGIDVLGATGREQLDYVLARCRDAERMAEYRAAVHGKPAVLAQIFATEDHESAWMDAFGQALGEFTLEFDWPVAYLAEEPTLMEGRRE